MRCDQCNKFVSLELQDDPEVDDEVIEEDGSISLSVRIVRCCADCGQELKEATLELEGKVDPGKHVGKKHELLLEVETSAFEESDGKGRPSRYTRTYFGAEAICTVTCSCGAEVDDTTLRDRVQASGMDELI